jgi:hypothetical protein
VRLFFLPSQKLPESQSQDYFTNKINRLSDEDNSKKIKNTGIGQFSFSASEVSASANILSKYFSFYN